MQTGNSLCFKMLETTPDIISHRASMMDGPVGLSLTELWIIHVIDSLHDTGPALF